VEGRFVLDVCGFPLAWKEIGLIMRGLSSWIWDTTLGKNQENKIKKNKGD
jgi:hypothetical protein